MRGITAYDAASALQHAAGLITLTGAAFTAGDVDKDAAVPPWTRSTSCKSRWISSCCRSPARRRVGVHPGESDLHRPQQQPGRPGLHRRAPGRHLRNWVSGGGALAAGIQANATATLSLSEAIIPPGAEATLNLKMAGGVADVWGLDLAVNYDPAVLQFVRAERGDLPGNWSLAHNAQSAGAVKIGLAGSGIGGGGRHPRAPTFRAIGAKGQNSALSFGTDLVNEGRIAVTIQAGRITVDTPPVTDLKCLKTEGVAKLTWTHVGKRCAPLRGVAGRGQPLLRPRTERHQDRRQHQPWRHLVHGQRRRPGGILRRTASTSS